MTLDPKVLIIELGSQTTLLIERTLRDIGVRSVVLGPKRASAWLESHTPTLVILSGGDASVYNKDAPQPPAGVLNLKRKDGSPVLVFGICYGMQWLVHHLGGRVERISDSSEYGEAQIMVSDTPHPLFEHTGVVQRVWMSHGDSVTAVPEGFRILARTASQTVSAMGNGAVWGVQFHPEVTHTRHGKTMLTNLILAARCMRDWEPLSLVASIRESMEEQVGKEENVLIGFSGGVDSTTASAILAPVFGKRLYAITIDGGHLREGELAEIKRHASYAKVQLRIIDARRDFAEVMAGTTDPEEKRQRFREVYTKLLMQAAEKCGATVVVQGTLAPDRIESGTTGGALIKSHHNVGLSMGTLRQLHPLEHLFKYEVRALAKGIGLPKSVWKRQPFPGPGLFLRILGFPATPERLDVVRWADARVQEILERHGVYNDISQLVVAYGNLPTVGVEGDARTYKPSILVRAVETADFMTAEGVWFPKDVVKEIKRVITAHPKVTRVWFDPTDKPPATTEFE